MAEPESAILLSATLRDTSLPSKINLYSQGYLKFPFVTVRPFSRISGVAGRAHGRAAPWRRRSTDWHRTR
jgi:hypothetical protein